MSYTIKIDGYEVTAATPADAAALLRELRKPEGTVTPPKSTEKPILQAFHGNGLSAALAEFDPNAADTALKFLKAIRQSGELEAKGLMQVLGVTAPKAIGSKSATVNKTLTRLGLKPKAVYNNPRTPEGRVWKPGRKMGEAIQLLTEHREVSNDADKYLGRPRGH
jgi:hypothetical protein